MMFNVVKVGMSVVISKNNMSDSHCISYQKQLHTVWKASSAI